MWHRVAFLAVTALVSGALYWIVDQTLLAPAAAGRAQIAQLRAELGELTQRVAVATKELAAVSGELPESGSPAVSGMDSVAALAWLQGLVRNQVAAAKGVALAFQATTSPLTDSHEKLSVVLRARFSEDGMLRFVRRLEESSPPVIFEQLEIQQLGAVDEGTPIDVTATITAFHANAASS